MDDKDVKYGRVLVEIGREITEDDLNVLYFLAPTKCPNCLGVTAGRLTYSTTLQSTLCFFEELRIAGSYTFGQLLEVLYDLLQAVPRQDLADKISVFRNRASTDSSSSALDTNKEDVYEENSPKPLNEEVKQDGKDTARDRKREKKRRYKQKQKQKKQINTSTQENVILKNDDIATAEKKALDITSPAKQEKSTNEESFVSVQNNQAAVGDVEENSKEKSDGKSNKAISDQSTLSTLPSDTVPAPVEKNLSSDAKETIPLDSSSDKGNAGTDVTNQQDLINVQSNETSEETVDKDLEQKTSLLSDPGEDSYSLSIQSNSKVTTEKSDGSAHSNLREAPSSEASNVCKGNPTTTHSWYILVICDKWHGWGNSVTVFNRELCLALARAGHCVACIVLNSSEVEIEEARKGNVELITCPETPGFKDDNPQRFQFLDFDSLPFAPNLVVGHGKVTGPAAVFYSEKKKALRLHVIHDLPDEYSKYDNIIDKKCNENDLARSADFVAAIGTLLHQRWSSVLNRDVMEIIPGLPNLETRNRISSPDDRFFVPFKFCSPLASGLSIAVEAVNQSSQRNCHPNRSFLMIRNTDTRFSKSTPKVLKEIDKKCVDWNLNEQPERKQALIDLQGATLVLSPSRTEAFGVSALDAIAIGIPVLISSRSGLAHTIRKNLPEEFHECVRDVKSECSGSADDDDEDDDVGVWANAIDKASYDRRKAFDTAEALRKKYETTFTWDKAAQLIVETILKSGKLPSRTETQHECLMSSKRIPDSTLKLVESLRLFDKRQKFVLVLSPCESALPEAVHLGLVPWVAVFDFDQHSVTNGHLKMCQNFLENTGNPACRIVPPRHKEEVKHLPNGVPWVLLQGTPALPRTLDHNLDWINEILNQIKKKCSCPVTFLIVWIAANQSKRVYKQLNKVLTVVESSPLWKNAVQMKFISASNTSDDRLEDISEDWDTKVHKVNLSDFFRAIHSMASSNPSHNPNADFSLPKLDESGKVQHEALPQPMRWVDSVFELLYTTVGDNPEYGKDDAYHFYRGGTISWYGIEMNYPVQRESWEPIKETIKNELKYPGATFRKLFHDRGTGGTTSAREILYDFHLQYPCVCLKTISQETFLALKVVWQFTSLPILILADIKEAAGADVYDPQALYSNLSNDKISCLIMHIVHRQQKKKEEEPLILAKTLTYGEQEMFHQVYSSQCPEKKSDLDQLRKDTQLQTPFFYGLVAFGDEFKGLEPFVQDCLKGLNDAQMLAMCFLGMALYYGQKEVPLSSLAGIYHLKPFQLFSIDDILPSSAIELLIEDDYGCWRPRHHTIAKEMVCQLLTVPYGINKKNWKLHLADKTKELVAFVDADLISAILLNRIYDEKTFKQFSSLIEDIDNKENVIKVFKEAMDAHPENPFFKAHLGRFYSVKMVSGGFVEALKYTDEAILLASEFNKTVRSQLTQMKGTVFKRQVKYKIEEKAPLEEIIALAEEGDRAFTRAVSISPDKSEGACIPQVRMMIDIFEYIDRTVKGGLFEYLNSNTAHSFIVSSITDASDVLETVSDSIYYPELRRHLSKLGCRNTKGDKEVLIAHFKKLKKTNRAGTASINRTIVGMELELCKEKAKAIHCIAGDLINLLEEALKYDDKINLTMRLWIKVAPYIPVSLASAETKIAAWCTKGKSVTSYLYRYIFMCIRVLEGSNDQYEDNLQKMRHQLHEAVRLASRDDLPHADSPVVFLGHGKGMGQLVLVEERIKEVRKKRTVPDEYYDRCRKLTGTITKAGKVGQIQAQGLTVPFRADLCEPTPLLGASYVAKKVTFRLAFTHFGPDGYNVRIIAD